jgi:hypothetical protein
MRYGLRRGTCNRRARMGHSTLPRAPHSSRWGLPVALLTAALLLAGAAVVHAQPANDDITTATPITSLPFDDSLDTSAATMAPDDPDCFGNGPTVWYTFTPTEDVSLFVDAQTDTTYVSTLSVYTGTPGNLRQLACSDTSVAFEADAGTTYWFMVGSSFSEFGGTLVFHAEVAPPGPGTRHRRQRHGRGRPQDGRGAGERDGTLQHRIDHRFRRRLAPTAAGERSDLPGARRPVLRLYTAPGVLERHDLHRAVQKRDRRGGGPAGLWVQPDFLCLFRSPGLHHHHLGPESETLSTSGQGGVLRVVAVPRYGDYPLTCW